MLYTHKTFEYEHPLKEADIAVLGVPFSSTETGHSVKYGPLFIREAISNLPGRDPETKTNIFEKYGFCDLGDISVVPGNWVLTEKAIMETIHEVLEENPKILPVLLGGEHLITLAAVKLLAEHHGNMTIIDFDAHRDLMPEWMGEKHSHITWAYHALKNPKISLMQLGCRSWSNGELEPFKERVKESLDKISGPVYITVDMDVFDPSAAPEVGTPEPLGMKPEEFFPLLKRACKNKLVGMDIVECASQTVNTQTAVLAANVFKKTLAYMVKQ